MADNWDAAETEKLREFVLRGLSAGEIASILHRTRNAVMGRIHRLKLGLARTYRSGGKIKKRHPGRRALAVACAVPVVVAPVASVPSRRPVEQPKEARVAPHPCHSRLHLSPGKSIAAAYAIEALEPDQCRWPLGHNGHPCFHFCPERRIGTNLFYCEAHMALSRRRPYVPRAE